MDLTSAELAQLAQLAYDRTEIADTLYRYAFGLDHGDPDSLASAFTEDCTFDFTPAGAKLWNPVRGANRTRGDIKRGDSDDRPA